MNKSQMMNRKGEQYLNSLGSEKLRVILGESGHGKNTENMPDNLLAAYIIDVLRGMAFEEMERGNPGFLVSYNAES